jgi:hydroxyethylthiazole kinase
MMTSPEYISRIWSLAETVRSSAPLVHNITNLVVQNDTADAIAAVGGIQITLHTLEEAREATTVAFALAINLGTLNEDLLKCARIAVDRANELGRPWVLDPVAAGMTAYRRGAAREFLALRPSILKANASEILALAADAGRGRGADSVDSVADAGDAARELADRFGTVVVVTGAEDLITDGDRLARVASGHPLMGRMIGSGCMLTSVTGCFLGITDTPFDAALAAVACFNVAGELATEMAGGPGTLKPLFIDALFHLDRDTLTRRLHMTA